MNHENIWTKLCVLISTADTRIKFGFVSSACFKSGEQPKSSDAQTAPLHDDAQPPLCFFVSDTQAAPRTCPPGEKRALCWSLHTLINLYYTADPKEPSSPVRQGR